MKREVVRVIETMSDRARIVRMIETMKGPYTITIRPGKRRSVEQNRLQRMWFREAADQGDMTAEEYRGFCKLHFGVPILRAENDEFCEAYDKVVRPLPYEQKLALMQVPIDLPVTRIMTTRQKAAYLDAVYSHFLEQGFEVTEPGSGA